MQVAVFKENSQLQLVRELEDTHSLLNSVAIGTMAGHLTQGSKSVAIGYTFRYDRTSPLHLFAVGEESGALKQGTKSVAIGYLAGQKTQGTKSVSIGDSAGLDSQGANSIAIGPEAGKSTQGSNSIAIGSLAGVNSQHANSVILNASGTTLDSVRTDSLYLAPIQEEEQKANLVYNNTTKEVTWSNTLVY